MRTMEVYVCTGLSPLSLFSCVRNGDDGGDDNDDYDDEVDDDDIVIHFRPSSLSGDFKTGALVAALPEADVIGLVLVLVGPVSVLCDWLK